MNQKINLKCLFVLSAQHIFIFVYIYQGQLIVSGTTASTSSSTGAMIVSGGAGIGGNTFVGGTLNAGLITENAGVD